MIREEKKYVIEALNYALYKCNDNTGDAETHFNTLANALEVIEKQEVTKSKN